MDLDGHLPPRDASEAACRLWGIERAFRQSADRMGEAPAVEGDGVAPSYAELDRGAERLAARLVKRGSGDAAGPLALILAQTLLVAGGLGRDAAAGALAL